MATATNPPLNSFARSIYSQDGEDGILEEILRRVESQNPLDRWCVEFGALDGVTFSNTCNLIRNHGYHAVLIEGDEQKHRKLCENLPGAEAIKVCQFVTLGGHDSLDAILRRTPIPDEFDFLSIDIDGCDYHIFESLESYRPKIICIEFNPSIPNEVEFVQPADFSIKQGSSAKSTISLAADKGYFLAATTATNLIFVRNEFKSVVGESSFDALRDDKDLRTFIFFGYDGTLLSNRPVIRVPWHRLTVPTARLQILPRFLRYFGEDYGAFRKLVFALFVLGRFPGDFMGLFREKVYPKWKRYLGRKRSAR